MITARFETIQRVLRDLTAAELARLRHSDPLHLRGAIGLHQQLGPDGFGMDSFEFMSVAGTVATMFHLYESGAEDELVRRPTIAEWARLVAESESPRVSFFSSGSTGGRTLHTHQRAELEREVAFFAELLGRPQRIVSTVPSHHIYGYLFEALLPDWYGCEPAGAGESAAEVSTHAEGPAAATLVEFGGLAMQALGRSGELLVTLPAVLEQLRGRGLLPGPGVTVVSSTAPCPPDLAADLRSAGCRLVEVYGSTETAGIGYREQDGAAYTLLPWWRRAGKGLKRDRGGHPGADAGPPAAAEVVTLPDEVEWHDERRFVPVRRRDGAIQVGGVNVYPGRVERVLAEHPAVAETAVRAFYGESGLRLKAFIVPGAPTDEAALEAELREYVSARLSAPERPAVYRFGPELPRNTMGKPADWEL